MDNTVKIVNARVVERIDKECEVADKDTCHIVVARETIGPAGYTGVSRQRMIGPITVHLGIAFTFGLDVVGLEREYGPVDQGGALLQHNQTFLERSFERRIYPAHTKRA